MRSTLRAALLALALVGLTAATPHAATAPTPWGSARTAFHAETETLAFVGSAPGSPLARPAGLDAAAGPEAVARAFLQQLGWGFGIHDQSSELRVSSVQSAPGGRDVVRFQQAYEGVPVLGAELIVNLDRDGNALSIGGDTLPAIAVSVVPGVPPAAARDAALQAVAEARGLPAATLSAAEPSLWIYDSRILGGPGLDVPTLVWRTDVTGAHGEPIDELVLVDAQLGVVALHFDQVEYVKNRQVCDANNAYTQFPCTAPVRTEGGAASGIQDVNEAYDFAGDVYDFYFGTLGRDGVDGAGLTLKSTTRWCAPALWFEPCPWPQAGWYPDVIDAMAYGQGYTHADDVVGHEITHGVTAYTSHLFSYYQSGAINESLSDVFGELIDQGNGKGTDTTATRWQLGEDVPGGVIRDMEDPTLFGDPDRMTSGLYRTGSSDNGGIHHNNGVNNKAAFLLTDGGTFNGRTVTGLGATKVAKIYYEGNRNLLTSAASYADLANALQQACTNLVGTSGITSLNCVEVGDAVQAVELTTPRTDPTPPPDAPGKPRNVVATAGTGSASLTWSAPATDGGSAITNYIVTPFVGGVAQSMRTYGTATSTTVTGLTGGTTYTFTVRAENSVAAGPASAASNAVTVKASQTISFGSLPSRTFGDADFAVSATASSGLALSFAAGGSCAVGGATVHLTGAGTCTITASQGGNDTYNAATSVSQSFSVFKANQTIVFGSLPGRTYGDPDFTASATTSSGLPVSFSAGGSCRVTGTSVHLTGSGTCTLTASQPGDANYNAATSVSRSFTVAQPKRQAQVVCRVPKVTGKTLASAKSAITKGHCRTGTVSYSYSKKVAKGKVVSQSRAAGKVLAASTKVNLMVSRGVKRH